MIGGNGSGGPRQGRVVDEAHLAEEARAAFGDGGGFGDPHIVVGGESHWEFGRPERLSVEVRPIIRRRNRNSVVFVIGIGIGIGAGARRGGDSVERLIETLALVAVVVVVVIGIVGPGVVVTVVGIVIVATCFAHGLAVVECQEWWAFPISMEKCPGWIDIMGEVYVWL